MRNFYDKEFFIHHSLTYTLNLKLKNNKKISQEMELCENAHHMRRRDLSD